MSDFREEPIETLDHWNAVLGTGCCCQMPQCPTPAMLCEQKTSLLNQDAGSEHEAFEETHDEWEAAAAVWIEANSTPEDQKTQADYIAAGFPEPAVPDDVLYGNWAQFDRPAGEDEDPLPAIYRKVTSLPLSAETILYTGDLGSKMAGNSWNTASAFLPPFVQSSWSDTVSHTYTNAVPPLTDAGATRSAVEATYNREGVITCDPTGSVESLPDIDIDGGTFPYLFEIFGDWVEVVPKSYDITAGVTITYISGTWEQVSGAAQTPDSCPGPWGQALGGDFLDFDWVDVTAKGADKPYELSDPITKGELRALTVIDMDAEEWGGSGCVAEYWSSWSPISQIDWDGVSNQILFNNAFENNNQRTAGAECLLKKSRFRFKIPYAHAGNYFLITYDVAEFPEGWDDTIDDPDYVPPVPNDPPEPIPQIPKPDRPLRSFVSEDNTVEWTGPGTPVPEPIGDPVTNQAAIDAAEITWLTEWNTMDPPEVPGERRVVNIRFICYGGDFGSKPQLTGEVLELDEG